MIVRNTYLSNNNKKDWIEHSTDKNNVEVKNGVFCSLIQMDLERTNNMSRTATGPNNSYTQKRIPNIMY